MKQQVRVSSRMADKFKTIGGLMRITGNKSACVLKDGKGDIDSEIEAIIDHVEKNGNCEFVRILEHYSKMDESGKKKLMGVAEKLVK